MVVLGEGGGVGYGGVAGGGNNGEKKVCFKMHFMQQKVFLDHVFFSSSNGKPGHRGPTHPILMENSINFFFFLKPSLIYHSILNIFRPNFGL